MRGRYRLLTPTERRVIVARFRAGARVKDVMAEFGLGAHVGVSDQGRGGFDALAGCGVLAASVVV